MPTLVIDDMDDATDWSGFEPDGVTPSTELLMVDETARFRFGTDQTSGRITGTTDAFDHTLRRSLDPVDLGDYDELRMWVFANRAAADPETKPFYLEIKLASADVPLDDPDNEWHRFFPISQPNTWELVRFSLADLPPEIRDAVTEIQLRCIDASVAFTLIIDDVLAARDEMIADVEAGLLARLHNKVSIDGDPVRAVIYAADVNVTGQPPYIRIMPYDLRYADARLTPTESRTDFSSTGYLLRPPSTPYELFYQITVFGQPRSSQTRILEFILKDLGGHGQLLVNNVPVPMQSVVVEPIDLVGGARDERLAMHYRISTRQEIGEPRPVRAVTTLLLETDQQNRGIS